MASPDDPLMKDELEALRRYPRASPKMVTYRRRLLMLGYIEEQPNGIRITERGESASEEGYGDAALDHQIT